jgi:predicted RNase H-like HicB family nuclease
MHIAYTPGLELYAQAATRDRARQTLEGALALFVTVAQKNQALAAMLP